MATYCNQIDLLEVFADLASFDNKVSLPELDFVVDSGSIYRLDNSGDIKLLYRDSIDLGSPTGSLNQLTGSDVWFNDSGSDILYVDLANNPTGSRFDTAPVNWSNRQDLAIQNASEKYESLLDNRFPRPLPKTTRSNSSRDYDTYIIQPVATLAVIELLEVTDPKNPLIQVFWNRLTNEDGSGIIDKINDGRIRLSFEITDSDRTGEWLQVVSGSTTTGYLSDPIGKTTSLYDLLTVTITTGGTLLPNAENTVIKYKVQDLEGTETISETVVDGFYQNVGAGLLARFIDGVYNTSDAWRLEVHGEPGKARSIKTIKLSKF